MEITDVTGSSGYDTDLYAESTLGKEDFLLLLVTQLQYQDPMDPMENTEFTAQLAQFSSLEEMYNMNDNLQSLLLYQASINNSQAVSFIGKDVSAVGNEIAINDGVPEDIYYDLAEDATEVTISIYDSDGELVRSIVTDPQEAGEQVVQWDGEDDDGNELPDGTYSCTITAKNEEGEIVSANTYIKGTVTGVTFEDGIVYLMLGDRMLTLSEVIKIEETGIDQEEGGE